MSLDFSLVVKKDGFLSNGNAFEIRETVFSANITHNLTKMAEEANLYAVLWHPELVPYYYAADAVAILEEGLLALENEPTHFKQFNSPNGWGMYEHFVEFVKKVLAACREFPDALIEVDR